MERLSMLLEYIREGHYSQSNISEACEILHNKGIIDSEKFKEFLKKIDFMKRLEDSTIPILIISGVMLIFGFIKLHIVAIILAIFLVYGFYMLRRNIRRDIRQELLPIMEISLYERDKKGSMERLSMLLEYIREGHYSQSNISEACEILHNKGIIDSEKFKEFLREIDFMKELETLFPIIAFVCLLVSSIGFLSFNMLGIIVGSVTIFILYRIRNDANEKLRTKVMNFYRAGCQ